MRSNPTRRNILHRNSTRSNTDLDCIFATTNDQDDMVSAVRELQLQKYTVFCTVITQAPVVVQQRASQPCPRTTAQQGHQPNCQRTATKGTSTTLSRIGRTQTRRQLRNSTVSALSQFDASPSPTMNCNCGISTVFSIVNPVIVEDLLIKTLENPSWEKTFRKKMTSTTTGHVNDLVQELDHPNLLKAKSSPVELGAAAAA